MDDDTNNIISTERILSLVPKVEEQEPVNDIPKMMRDAADRIEQGDWGEADGGVFILHNTDGDLFVFGWGEDVPTSRDVLHYMIKAREVF